MTRVVLVPGALALLPAYASLDDPVAELRAACLAAVAWLGPDPEIHADPQGARVAASVAGEVAKQPSRGPEGPRHPRGHLVVGNGTATRTEKAPGFLDERAAAYDAHLGAALRAGDTAALGALDLALGAELWASLDGIAELAGLLTPGTPGTPPQVDYDDAPFGVQYWVMRWGS